ncbi:MAG: hypothetical protein BJ554DRAFT_1594 [Olpidium bornovanus]|uniref:Uncharacterized protein n=1 Tax=Olpidium bornovanus TaxID=278681 RepID=A0A8H8DH36_9FUNG|nr:MAG: hypothetical protein BJ554DRAFT_1594 [Olpidium bornovanus]
MTGKGQGNAEQGRKGRCVMPKRAGTSNYSRENAIDRGRRVDWRTRNGTVLHSRRAERRFESEAVCAPRAHETRTSRALRSTKVAVCARTLRKGLSLCRCFARYGSENGCCRLQMRFYPG